MEEWKNRGIKEMKEMKQTCTVREGKSKFSCLGNHEFLDFTIIHLYERYFILMSNVYSKLCFFPK